MVMNEISAVNFVLYPNFIVRRVPFSSWRALRRNTGMFLAGSHADPQPVSLFHGCGLRKTPSIIARTSTVYLRKRNEVLN